MEKSGRPPLSHDIFWPLSPCVGSGSSTALMAAALMAVAGRRLLGILVVLAVFAGAASAITFTDVNVHSDPHLHSGRGVLKRFKLCEVCRAAQEASHARHACQVLEN